MYMDSYYNTLAIELYLNVSTAYVGITYVHLTLHLYSIAVKQNSYR